MKQTSSQIPEQTSSQIPEQTPSQIQENPDNIHVRRSRFHIFEGLRYLIKTKDDLRIFIENSQVFSEELKNLILWEIEDLKENGTLEVTKKINQQSDIKDFIKFIGFMDNKISLINERFFNTFKLSIVWLKSPYFFDFFYISDYN